jgi:hypothetical protein
MSTIDSNHNPIFYQLNELSGIGCNVLIELGEDVLNRERKNKSFENITETDDNPDCREKIMHDSSILMQELVNGSKAALDKK